MDNFFDLSTPDPEYRALTPRILNFFEKQVLPSWWVIFFLLLCYMFYERSLKSLNVEFKRLNNQYIELQQDKIVAMNAQEDFQLQINSQSDQDWVELTLMKGLGLVPEEQIKVFFYKN